MSTKYNVFKIIWWRIIMFACKKPLLRLEYISFTKVWTKSQITALRWFNYLKYA